MIEYIYKIENLVNHRVYIGRTKNPSARKNQHFNALKKNKHSNPKLQNSYNKHGKDCFDFTIVDSTTSDSIAALEYIWFEKYDLDEAVLYNCHFNTEGGKSLLPSEKQALEDKMVSILQDGFTNDIGIVQLARKYNVSSEYLNIHTSAWEVKYGKRYIHIQEKAARSKLEIFIKDLEQDEETTLANRDSYGIPHGTFAKYLEEYGYTLEDISMTKWREQSIENARLAYEYKVENRCTVMKALKTCNAGVTTFYKYVEEWRAGDSRPFNSKEVAKCVLLEMSDGMTMNKACKKWKIGKDTVKKYCPNDWQQYKNQSSKLKEN